MPEALKVVIEDDDNSPQIDPETGASETLLDNGDVVVNLNDHRKKDDDGESEWYDNLAVEMQAMTLAGIANDLLDQIDADIRSRQGHLDVIARGLGLLGLKLEQPKSTVGDSSA